MLRLNNFFVVLSQLCGVKVVIFLHTHTWIWSLRNVAHLITVWRSLHDLWKKVGR